MSWGGFIAGSRSILLVGIVSGIVALSGGSGPLNAAQQAQPDARVAASTGASPERAMLDKYCVTCHNTRLRTGQLELDTVDIANVAAQPEVWEKVVRKLR